MAQRTFVHVGPPKTGSSYLQSIWRGNKEALGSGGLLYPGTQGNEQFRAYVVATQNKTYLKRLDAHGLGTWDRFTQEIGEWQGDAVLSCEHYARIESPAIAQLIADLNKVSDEVHVVITGRDLARQVMASWQQSVKMGSTKTFDRFWRGKARESAGSPNSFWRGQDLAGLARRWGAHLPQGNVHLVVHGPRGTPADRLWHQLCAVTQTEPTFVPEAPVFNRSLGVAEIEVLRRVNETLPSERDRFTLGALSSKFLTNQLRAVPRPSERVRIPAEALVWAAERSAAMVAELRALDLHVVGDLDHLLVDPAASTDGRLPHEVTDTEVAEVSTALMSQILLHEAHHRETERLKSRAHAEERDALRARISELEKRRILQRAVGRARNSFSRTTDAN